MNTPSSVWHTVHPTEVERRLCAHLDSLRLRQQLAAQLDHRWEIDGEPAEFMTHPGGVEAIEAGLQTLRQRNHGGSRVVGEVAACLGVEGQRADCDVLTAAQPELGPFEIDGVHQPDRHRVVDDRIRPARLVGAYLQRQQGSLGDTGQHSAVDLRDRSGTHTAECTYRRTFSIVRRLRVVVDDL